MSAPRCTAPDYPEAWYGCSCAVCVWRRRERTRLYGLSPRLDAHGAVAGPAKPLLATNEHGETEGDAAW